MFCNRIALIMKQPIVSYGKVTAGEGYGVICYQGKQIYIHRLIYEYVFGELPNIIRHSCDTPNCWNPDHLHDGTHADNVADKVESNDICLVKIIISRS